MEHDNDLDYALKVLARRELELTPEFRRWITDRRHRELYTQLKAMYDAIGMNEGALPDTQAEWERLQRGVREKRHAFTPRTAHESPGHRKLTVRLIGIAASVCLLVWIGTGIHSRLSEPEVLTLTRMDPHPQEITLSNDGGQSVLVLSEQTDADTLSTLGATLTDGTELAYGQEQAASAEPRQQTLRTPRGKDFRLVLADGTTVWLNAESTLEYPSHFDGEERVVRLTGEAYFRVAPDPEHPFIVQTPRLEAQVLGTGFNVCAYEGSRPHVTLVEGKLAVASPHYHLLLRPGENAELDEDGSIRIREVDTRVYTAWMDGYFYFDNASLADIARALGEWYNLTVDIADPRAADYHFTLWVNRRESIAQVVSTLNELGKVKASLDAHTLTIN